MAIYHLCVKIIGRGSGRSAIAAAAYRAAEKLYNYAVAAAAYRSGEELHSKHDETTYDYTRKRGVVYTEIILPENAPKEYENRNVLWNAVEKSEKRKDAQTAREVEVALPVEFTLQEQTELLREYIADNFVSAGMCADYAIHDKKDGNPHAHIMLTTRHISESGFGGKNRDWNSKEHLEEWREKWANVCNKRLKEKGFDVQIDHRTLEEQGLEREPTIHVGRSIEREKQNQEIIMRNERFLPAAVAEYMNELQEGYKIIENHLTECSEKQREVDRLNHYIKNMTDRATDIVKMQTELEKAKIERASIKFWQSKNDIDEKIDRLINSESNARNFFERTFKVKIEAVPDEIQRIKAQIEPTDRQIQEYNLERLSETRNMIVMEYQRQKLLTEIRLDGKKILSCLNKAAPQLEYIPDKNFNRILQDLKPAQVRILIDKRKETMIRRKSYERIR